MEWAGILEDPHGGDFNVTTRKNRTALNQMHNTIEEAKGIFNQTTLGMKNTVAIMLSAMNVKEIIEALQLDDPESNYHALRNASGKQHIEALAIIFTGSYNNGVPSFPPNFTPYDIVDTRMEYTAILKINWRDVFPSIVTIQRIDRIPKSTYEKFLLSNSIKSKKSVHVSHFTSPDSDRSHRSCSASYSSSIEDYDSYTKTNEKTITDARHLSSSTSHLSAIVNEYVTDIFDANGCGYAMITEIDNTSHYISFNLHAIMKDDRTINGKAGTHQWKVFKEMDILGKLHVHEGNYVVVLGVRNKKIHVEDPSHPLDSISKIRTFLDDPAYFFLLI